MLWGLAIGDRYNNTVGCIGQSTARGIVGIEVGDDPTAAVEIDQHGEGALSLRLINTRQQIARWAWYELMADITYHFDGRLSAFGK
jgi:hypothetical protein